MNHHEPLDLLPAIVWQRARTQPEAIAYRFFTGPTLVPDVLSFYAVWQQAASLACLLQERELDGGRVLLSCKSQKFFVIGFIACLLAGCVAVPTPPPRRRAVAGRLQLLAGDAQIRAVIADDEQFQADAFDSAAVPLVFMPQWQGTDHAAQAARWRMPALHAGSLAFLQYTSGSTADPKGVMVTHGNLVNNCAAIQEAMAFAPHSSILTALPLFHDMGLVGGVLESMYAGCIGNCMPPSEFVQYPERWLQLIAKFGITISGGPNFMYDLAARAVTPEQMAGLDLSAWQVAFCGAEPIRAATIERFTARFVDAGFRPAAFYPCYGMAESTLFITGKHIDAMPAVCTLSGSKVVSCGTPRHDTEVRIVDPEVHACLADGLIGEIWVAGRSVAAGYWRREELSESTFAARLRGHGDTPYLRTGDLGYVKDGELYVTGRLNDLIILYGKKYAPQDIEEEALNSHQALREAGSAALGVVRDGKEMLVLVCELKRDWLRRTEEWPAVARSISSAVVLAHGMAVDDVVFINPGALPRTSSGKVRRAQCQLDYLSGALGRLPAA